MRGPIDYIIVSFDQPTFEGKIIDELKAATDAGTIAVLALTLIQKQEDGTVQEIAIDNQSAVFASYAPLGDSLVDEEDIQEAGSLLEPGAAAGFVIIEHLWAKGLKQVILDTGGTLIAEGRIHPEAASELEES